MQQSTIKDINNKIITILTQYKKTIHIPVTAVYIMENSGIGNKRPHRCEVMGANLFFDVTPEEMLTIKKEMEK